MGTCSGTGGCGSCRPGSWPGSPPTIWPGHAGRRWRRASLPAVFR